MNVKQLEKACQQYPFILCRQANGELIGVNTKVALLGRKTKYAHLKTNQKTVIISFQPCDFQTYITYKTGYL